MSILLYPHGGSGNHGCEAIVRSTAQILGTHTLKLYSSNPKQDFYVRLNDVCEIHRDRVPISRMGLSYLKSFIDYHILNKKDAFELLSLSPIVKTISKGDILLSIGGDNYCYGTPSYILLLNAFCRKKGIKTILWGCSIEESAIKTDILEDLHQYTHIFARESITYSALVNKGLKNVSLFPDPAFALKKKSTNLSVQLQKDKTIGINMSPLITNYESSDGITLQNYVKLISYIIHDTNFDIALIPHVSWPHNDDRIPLGKLYYKFKSSSRVVMIDDLNAEEIKGVISQCRFFIAARTHASIAAYSTCVPTLVVGYSVKAKGIAKDIFGTWDNHVIPVQSFKTNEDLTQRFKCLMQNEKDIRSHLEEFMPPYIQKAVSAGDILRQL